MMRPCFESDDVPPELRLPIQMLGIPHARHDVATRLAIERSATEGADANCVDDLGVLLSLSFSLSFLFKNEY